MDFSNDLASEVEGNLRMQWMQRKRKRWHRQEENKEHYILSVFQVIEYATSTLDF